MYSQRRGKPSPYIPFLLMSSSRLSYNVVFVCRSHAMRPRRTIYLCQTSTPFCLPFFVTYAVSPKRFSKQMLYSGSLDATSFLCRLFSHDAALFLLQAGFFVHGIQLLPITPIVHLMFHPFWVQVCEGRRKEEGVSEEGGAGGGNNGTCFFWHF